MSDEKRQQLIAEGKLNSDGTRKLLCPTCKTELSPEVYEEYIVGAASEGSATAMVRPEGVVTDTTQEATE